MTKIINFYDKNHKIFLAVGIKDSNLNFMCITKK